MLVTDLRHCANHRFSLNPRHLRDNEVKSEELKSAAEKSKAHSAREPFAYRKAIGCCRLAKNSTPLRLCGFARGRRSRLRRDILQI
jgi:hypothetical protein